MKQICNTFLILFSVGFFFVAVESCKKGEGDPFLSLKSRKDRLNREWKVISLTSKYTYNNKKFETSFSNGVKKTVFSVSDTTPEYSATLNYHGNIYIDYQKDGRYGYVETFQNDDTGEKITIENYGYWYFMGPNKEGGFKDKELLAMQVTDYSYNPSTGGDYTTTFQGQNSLDVYEINTLKSKELILKINKTETIDFIKYSTTLEMKLSPK